MSPADEDTIFSRIHVSSGLLLLLSDRLRSHGHDTLALASGRPSGRPRQRAPFLGRPLGPEARLPLQMYDAGLDPREEAAGMKWMIDYQAAIIVIIIKKNWDEAVDGKKSLA